jgi:alpha-L-rhamnosidase
VITPPLAPTGLRCAHLVNPLGVAPRRVRLSWQLDGTGTGQSQSAYQVQVTPETGEPGAAWDSGRIGSGDSTDIPYAGIPLRPAARYRWRVRVWDEDGGESAWSEPAWFEVELDPAGWRAKWIRPGRPPGGFRPPSAPTLPDPVIKAMHPVPCLRRSFTLASQVRSARLYVSALGLYEARLNGAKVGDAFLAPGWTDYASRIPYQTYDVTSMLRQGENVLGALLADGWYCGFVGFDGKRAGAHYGSAPEFLAQLAITLADGSEELITTSESWQSHASAIRHSDLLMGESQDLRLEPAGWDAPGFDAGGWQDAEAAERDRRPLVADPAPPVRVTEEIAPRRITRDPAGRHIVDFGQNLTGWVRISLAGAAGVRIRVRHGEVLAADGSLYTENLRSARQADEYVSSGGTQTLEPRFTLHGFRYAEISGYPGEPGPDAITARVAHSDIPPAGSFESSQPWLNQLFRAIDWGQRGNFISVPTDCPQRDERLGWMGDAQIFARTACYNRDVAAFLGKWLDDVTDAQLPSGAYTDIAPRLHMTWAGAPAWGDAGVIVPWTLYSMYGDRGILQRTYPAMSRWMDFLAGGNPGFLRERNLGNSYNDWLAPGDDNTPQELLATAYWAHDASLMAEIAEAIGRQDDAAAYRELGAKIRAAFAAAFVEADGRITSGTQTAYVLGLHMNLVPDALASRAAAHLVDAIRVANWHLTTGFVGVGYLLPVLSAAGYTDVAYRLLEQESRPSWRYMLSHGATTIWERWDGWSEEAGFQSPEMNSFNHYALGSVGEWLYRFVLGIDQEPGTAGFSRVVLRPHPGGSLTSAEGSYRSVRGTIQSGWQASSEELVLRVALPPNVTASVRLPSADPEQVRDGDGAGPAAIAPFPGAPVAAGVREAVFEIGSGRHEFRGPAADLLWRRAE